MEKDLKSTPILVVGDTGTGKSTLLKGLNPARTFVMNTEDKVLPVQNAHEYKNVYVTNYTMIDKILTRLIELGNPEDPEYGKYENVVIDSFTSITEIVERYADRMFQGYTQWKKYNEFLGGILVKIKKLPQNVIVTGIPEQKDVMMNDCKQYIRVKGKELKYGNVEKEFTIVLFTEPEYDEDTGELTDVKLKYKANKWNSAKSPSGLFTSEPSNDGQKLFDAVNKYYGR